jgi:hypothetical protein
MSHSKFKYAWLVGGLAVLTVVLLTPPVAYGQAAVFARLVGTVKDQTEAVVPGVEVTATNTATNVPRMAITNDRGDYIIDKVPAGTYDLKAELPGFKTQVSLGVILAQTQVARIDFVLTPGEIAEQVTVTGQSTVIDTDTAEVSSVIEEKKILDLPLRGRDLVKLAYLTTGGTQENQETGYTSLYAYGGGYPSFNGQYSHSNQIMLDGSNNMGYITQRPTVQATPETIQEFKVITNNYSAEYGRVGGAVISMLSKSGSNEFHGHGWLYYRDEAFDAANFFDNKSGASKLPITYNIFGGSVGGPIIKDKTFFHAHYERFNDDSARTSFVTVPTAAVVGGDFSGSGPNGPIDQLYNPFDVVDGQRQPFAGNQIPSAMRGAVYSAIMARMAPPTPNQTGGAAFSDNYGYARTTNSTIDKYSMRGDHHFGNDDTLFARFSWQRSPQFTHTGRYGVEGATQDGIYRQFQDRSRGWQTGIGWVNPMGSNLVTEFTASLWEFTWLISRPLEETNWPLELGYDDGPLWQTRLADGSRGGANMPGISPDGYTGWTGATESPLSDWGMGYKYTASWRRGDHYLKFGIEHTRNLDVNYRWIPPYQAGRDSYDGFATGQIVRNTDGSIAGSTFGEGWADFMLGVPSNVSGNNKGLGENTGHFNQSHYNWFVQDDWKVGPNLTLYMGLRWEAPLPPYYEGSPDGRYKTDYYYCAKRYAPNQRIDPIQTAPKDFDIGLWQGPQGVALEIQNLDRRGCHEPVWSYFAPRLGLAWRMFGNNKTVLRMGVGLTYDQEGGILRARTMIPPLGRISDISERGFETPTLVTGQRLGLPTQAQSNEFQTCYFSELDWQEGQVYSYNLSIQHEIFQATKLEVAYVGNQGRHIREISPFGVAMPEGYVAPMIGGGSVQLTSDPITVGPRPWIPGDTEDRTWSGQRARRVYPQQVINVMLRPHGNTAYNSLQIKMERRFQDGLAISSGYTWSRAMALNYNGTWGDWSGSRDFERHALKSPMRSDRSSTFYNSTIWELPFFRNSDGMTKTIAGGWEATTIITLTTGAPHSVNWGTDLWNQGRRRRTYVDRIGDGDLGGAATVERWFDTSAFTAPGIVDPNTGFRVQDSSLCPAGEFPCHESARRALGNSAPYPLRYDGVPLFDISLHKVFAFSEEKSFDFRVDMFNAFNHAIFNAPQGNIESSSAGRVTSAATARQIQLGFRFSF